ncbi:MAG: helix-turn-helix domain-containing protein [Planctomycetota bacterium]
MSCGEIAEQFPIAQATVSHHLKVLVEVRLVEVRKAGRVFVLQREPIGLRLIGSSAVTARERCLFLRFSYACL